MATKVRTGTDAKTDSYEYDLNNRLIHVTVTDDQNSVTEYEYGYDSKGNRVLKEVTPDGGSTTTTTYLVDSNNGTGYSQVFEESSYVSGGASTTTSYLIGDDVIAQSTGGQISFLNYDGHGSTRFLTDVDGLIRSNSRYHYDAFGMAIGFDPATATTHLLYTGEQFDPGIHQYYLRARYYDPAIGQFSSFDSYEGVQYEPLTLHKYAYTHGNPVNSIDPTGQFTVLELVIVATIIAIVFAVIWWVHYWVTVPPTLAGVKCTVGELKSVSQWLKAASTSLANAKDNAAYGNLGELLNVAGVTVVGQYGVGAVGSGGALPPGEKAIVEYFETVRWNRFHPEATMHPVGFYANNYEGAKLWAEAEIDRISIVVKEIDYEIARRESSAGGQP